MASTEQLRGTDLIDCARANFSKGLEVAASRCGYGEDLETFEQALKQACDYIGVELHSFEDLSKGQPRAQQEAGIEIAPDTPTQL